MTAALEAMAEREPIEDRTIPIPEHLVEIILKLSRQQRVEPPRLPLGALGRYQTEAVGRDGPQSPWGYRPNATTAPPSSAEG